jgi:hypothetical protein
MEGKTSSQSPYDKDSPVKSCVDHGKPPIFKSQCEFSKTNSLLVIGDPLIFLILPLSLFP